MTGGLLISLLAFTPSIIGTITILGRIIGYIKGKRRDGSEGLGYLPEVEAEKVVVVSMS
jgi:hypothetical protein